MEKITVYKMPIKGLKNDDNGIPQYIWLTEKQVDDLMERQYDPELSDKCLKYGKVLVRPSDVISPAQPVALTEDLIKNNASFRGYVLGALMDEGLLPEKLQKVAIQSGYSRLISEKREQLGQGDEVKQVNEQGKKRLEELKSQYNLGRVSNEN